MDFLKLSSSTFKPVDLIENKTSLIWTERYKDPGEFEFKTVDVKNTMELLPIGSLVSILQSKEVAMVETHSITTSDNGYEELTLRGRTLDFFIENRVIAGDPTKKRPLPMVGYAYQAAIRVLWNAFVNNTTRDQTFRALYGHNNSTVIPNVAISGLVRLPDATKRTQFVSAGELAPQVLDFLGAEGTGLRTVRPPTGARNIYYVQNQDPYPLLFQRTDNSDSLLLFEVYTGLDRSPAQTDRQPVLFDYGAGHLEKPNYVFSAKNYKNIVVVDTNDWGSTTFYESNNHRRYGLDRREAYFNIGNVAPQGPNGGAPTQEQLNEVADVWNTKGYTELNAHQKAKILDARVTESSPYTYGIHYELGDKVYVAAKYGIKQYMYVTEYVRSENSSGETGYPTLSHQLTDDNTAQPPP